MNGYLAKFLNRKNCFALTGVLIVLIEKTLYVMLFQLDLRYSLQFCVVFYLCNSMHFGK